MVDVVVVVVALHGAVIVVVLHLLLFLGRSGYSGTFDACPNVY